MADSFRFDSDLRVLVVDDLAPACRVVRALLGKLGITDVTTSSSIAEAISSVVERVPDVVIADLNLSDGSGLDLIANLRGQSSYADLPVIIITSDPTREQVVAGADLGVDAFLLKPFDAGQLGAKLREAFRDL